MKETIIVLSTVIFVAVLLMGAVLLTAFGCLDRVAVGYFLLGGISVTGVIVLVCILGYLLSDNQ